MSSLYRWPLGRISPNGQAWSRNCSPQVFLLLVTAWWTCWTVTSATPMSKVPVGQGHLASISSPAQRVEKSSIYAHLGNLTGARFAPRCSTLLSLADISTEPLRCHVKPAGSWVFSRYGYDSLDSVNTYNQISNTLASKAILVILM